MRYTAAQYAKALFEALNSTKPEHQDLVLDNFTGILAKNSDLKLIEGIEEEFHKLRLNEKGTVLAEAKVSKPLSEEAEKSLIKKLNEIVGKKVEIKQKIEKDLIGGVVVRLDDTVIDVSIKRQLEDLNNNLTK
jgi:F-type H+-transporting ATPase subunit delta